MHKMLIHPGFHKTGTTSVQKMLIRNKKRISQETHVFLHRHIQPVCEWARAYSASRETYDLVGYTLELTEFLQRLIDAPRMHVCISAEDLLGHMPGRRGLTSYDAAPVLMKTFVETVENVLPFQMEMIFYFSVRDAEPWLKSCHSQHLRTVKMELDEAQYIEAYRDSARLGRVIDLVRVAVAPHRVEWGRLEDTRDLRLGPLEPIIDLLEISSVKRAQIKTLPPQNEALPDSLRQEFLRINRSDMPWPEAQLAKKMAKKHWHGAQKSADG